MGASNKASAELDVRSAELLKRTRAAKEILEAPGGSTREAKAERKSLKRLVADGKLISLGLRRRRQCYAVADSSARDIVLRLALEALRKRGQDRLTLCAATKSAFEGDTLVPTKVRTVLPEALRVLKETGEAHIVLAGKSPYYILRSDLEQTVAAMQRLAAKHGTVPVNDISPVVVGDDVSERVRSAYRALRAETGRNRVFISDIQKRSRVPLAAVHRFLDDECTSHRANPSRGEVTAATPEQREAALSIDGEPHLYIELLK